VKAVPAFDDADDESRFWKTHDPLEYVDFEGLSDFIRGSGNKSVVVALRIEPLIREQTKKIAKERGLKYQSLMREWIYAGLESAISSSRKRKTEIEKLMELVLEIGRDLDELRGNITGADTG
jgi:hypothetical protein